MKRCIKSNCGREALQAFVAVNPSSTWEQFRNNDPEGYRRVREALCADQHNLCAYCEIKLTEQNRQIAHFHPKSDYSTTHDWAFDWENLWLACKGGTQTWDSNQHHFLPPLSHNRSCDEFKGDKTLDGAVFSPSELPAFPRLFKFEQYADHISIRVDEEQCQIAGIDVDKVQRTIDEFNLNCTRLSQARLAVHREIENAVKKLRNTNVDQRRAYSHLVQKHLSSPWSQFFTMIRWRFNTIAEDHLHAIGYEG